MADYLKVFALCKPQRNASTPKGIQVG